MAIWLIAILCREIMLQAESDIGASGAAEIADSAIARGRAEYWYLDANCSRRVSRYCAKCVAGLIWYWGHQLRRSALRLW